MFNGPETAYVRTNTLNEFSYLNKIRFQYNNLLFSLYACSRTDYMINRVMKNKLWRNNKKKTIH